MTQRILASEYVADAMSEFGSALNENGLFLFLVLAVAKDGRLATVLPPHIDADVASRVLNALIAAGLLKPVAQA